MPETRTITVYKFEELSETAKDNAVYNSQANDSWHWDSDWLNSLKALAAHFYGRLEDYEIDWSGGFRPSYAKFDMPDEMDEEDIKANLDNLGDYNPETLEGFGECRLTGYCGDESAIDGVRKAFHEGERNLDALMQSGFDTWLKAVQSDYNDFYDHDNFADHCETNNYRFDVNGNLV